MSLRLGCAANDHLKPLFSTFQKTERQTKWGGDTKMEVLKALGQRQDPPNGRGEGRVSYEQNLSRWAGFIQGEARRTEKLGF